MFPTSQGRAARIVRGLVLVVWGIGSAAQAAEASGTARALIVVGLPGDDAHASKFGETARRWRDWLTDSLGFDPTEVRILGAVVSSDAGSRRPATREAIADELARLRRVLVKDDRLWVFLLGHASHDGEHLFVHLPGPDLRDVEFGDLFRGLDAREQVFWMTTAGSGGLVRPLSAPGRIVIAATERDQELNETEFPQALGAISSRPPGRLDADRDGKVSVLELFDATVAEVAARYAADKRIPTEHAQLDDNGDGHGSEEPGRKPGDADGKLAAGTIVLPRP
jgi:hypothetical protein